jgi:nucleoside 2-deoxyribosyltransferase
MTITLCTSLSHFTKCKQVKENLEKQGYTVLWPWAMEELSANRLQQIDLPAFKAKNQSEAIIVHYNKIKQSDAILVVNEDKNDIKNYIGGNTFLEMGFAYVLKKKIFVLNPIPEVSYKEEILAMKPTIIYGKLDNIRF